jgi:hypothetical protein
MLFSPATHDEEDDLPAPEFPFLRFIIFERSQWDYEKK